MGGRGSSHGAMLGRTTAQDKTVRKIEKQTRDLKKEQLRIVDRDGNVVLEKKGSHHEVVATVGEKREYSKNNLVIHNHPAGGTFSDADLKEFGFGAREIVVAAPEGTYRLVNAKFGTKQQYEGWVGLQDGVTALNEQAKSYATLRQEARENTNNSAAAKGMRKIESNYSSIMQKDGKEAANAYAMSTKAEYDKLTAERKSEIDSETRRLEVAPYHDYYKKNAAKYGFIYRFEKRK